MSEKMQNSSRPRKRTPEDIAGLCDRIRKLIEMSGLRQADFGRSIGGGWSDQLISRIVTHSAVMLPLDFLVQLARWADAHGFCVRWLLTGEGGPNDIAALVETVADEHAHNLALLMKLAELMGFSDEKLFQEIALEIAKRRAKT